MKVRYKQKDIICGDRYITTTIYPEYAPPNKSRRKKSKPTTEIQQKLNDKKRDERVVNLINTNYTENDYYITLTYNDEHLPENYEEAVNTQALFIARIRYYAKRNGLPMPKIIAVTGYGEKRKRLHHHLIISGFIPATELTHRWKDRNGEWIGWVDIKILQFDKFGVEGVARYFMKHISQNKKFGIKTPYFRSRNLDEPKEKIKNAKLSRRQIEFANTFTDFKAFEQLHPDYEIADVSPFYNDCNGGYYFTIKYYRKKYPQIRDKRSKINNEVSRRQKSNIKRHRKYH